MKRRLLNGFCWGLLLIVWCGVNLGCSQAKHEQSANASNQSTSPPVKNEPQSALRKRLEEIAGTAQGRVGVSAVVVESNEVVSLNEDGQFPMQSVYKFPIALAVLAQVEQGKLSLEQRVRVEPSEMVSKRQVSPIRDRFPQGTELSLSQILKYSVSDSDGTACDVLLRLVGGPEAVMKYLRENGINDIIVANTEKEIGQDDAVQYRNWAKPKATTALLRLMQEGRVLSESNRALLRQWMTETPTSARRIKGLLPAGTVVAHKTGSSGTVNGLAPATNDIGLVTLPDGKHLAISVFVTDSKADEATREGVIAKITRAIWDEFAR